MHYRCPKRPGALDSCAFYKHGAAAFHVGFHELFGYLSPLQLETMLFLIFVRNDRYASMWRGGTLEKYDLRIELDEEPRPFLKGSSYIQIKKKEIQAARWSEKHCVVHAGSSDFTKRLVSCDWIEDHVRQSDYLKQWLSRSQGFIKIERTKSRIEQEAGAWSQPNLDGGERPTVL